MYPNDTAACLAQSVPSVELLPVLDVLTPVMLEVDGQIDALVAVQRHIALLQARETELLAALDASDTSRRTGSPATWSPQHCGCRRVGCAGRWPPPPTSPTDCQTP